MEPLGAQALEQILREVERAVREESPEIYLRKVTSHPTTGGYVSLPKKWRGDRVMVLFYPRRGFAILIPV